MPVLERRSDGTLGLLSSSAPLIQPKETSGSGGAFRPNQGQDCGWVCPEELRSFKDLPRIGLDIEGKDPFIGTKGPGAHRLADEREAYNAGVVGLAIAYASDDATYYPTRHKKDNMDNPDQFWNQMRAEALTFEGEMVGANLQYDLDWLRAEHDVKFPKAKFRDVQIAEPLLDENRMTYKLQVLSDDYLGHGKLVDKLRDIYGSGYIEHMDEVHPSHAAFYGEGDTTIPWKIMDIQQRKLEAEGLTDLFHMESRLTPLLLEMRYQGVRVDHTAAEEALIKTREVRDEALAQIKQVTGINVEVWSADSIARAFDAENIPYSKTATGKPSFTKGWLKAHESPLAQMIIQAREYDKIGSTFIESYILNGAIRHGDEWRIHAMFNQLKSDDSGTVSGRFSSSSPNLQNIPSRHPILGPLCRSIFIPEHGKLWGSLDWSQIEYRFLVHYAHLTKGIDAMNAVLQYRNNPNADFHQMAADLTGLARKDVKAINFGIVYGMGAATLAAGMHISLDEAKALLAQFRGEAPFMSGMLDRCSNVAASRGFIKTILGRKRRFETWEVKYRTANGQLETEYVDTPEKDALLTKLGSSVSGMPRRAFTHKALNALLQGSAADLMKQAMVQMWEDGLFDVLTPHLTVHDEFNSSVPDTPEGREAFEEMRHIMETTMTLEVPVRADGSLAKNWKEAK